MMKDMQGGELFLGARVAALSGVLLVAVVGCNQGGSVEDKAVRSKPAGPVPEVAIDLDSNPTSIVCSVDGTTLTQGEVDAQIRQNLAAGGMGGGLDPEIIGRMRGRMTQQIVDRFVVETLFTHEADRRKIAVASNDVEKALSEIRERVPEGSKLEDLLAQHGRDMNQLKSDVMHSLKIKTLLEECTADVKEPTEEEVKAFYTDGENMKYFETPESVNVRHILVKSEAGDDEAAQAAAKEKVEGLRKQLIDGADFAELAKANSDCPSKERGGDLGNVTRGKTVKEFEDAAFSQKVDEIGPIVKSDFGYHIIQVQGHTEAGMKPLDEVKGDITEFLSNQRRQEAISNYVDTLKGKADIAYGSATNAVRSSTSERLPE